MKQDQFEALPLDTLYTYEHYSGKQITLKRRIVDGKAMPCVSSISGIRCTFTDVNKEKSHYFIYLDKIKLLNPE